MRKLILSVVLAACAFAQAPQIADTVTFKDTRNAINTALTSLYNVRMPNPFTTRGDLLFQGASAPSRLAVGINGQCLLSNGTEPYWGSCSIGSGGTWGSITGTLTNQTDLAAALAGKEAANANIQTHIASVLNPHSVTKAQVGLTNVTDDAQLKIASNLSDLANVSTARGNLGLGTAALANLGTGAGQIPVTGQYEKPLTFSSLFSRVGDSIDWTACTEGQVRKYTSGAWTCAEDQVGSPGSGEANTASNTGTVGVGVFKTKILVDLQFYKLYSTTNRLTVGLNGTDRIDLTINEGNIDHQSISGAGANTHAQIDSHIASTSNPHNTTAAQAGAPALTLLTTLGDTVYRDGSGWQRLAGNTVASKRFLSQTGNGATSAAPAWSALVAGDIPDISATYQPLISAGTTSQYYRGDKSWQTLDKTSVGLANVDNTSDANKAVSTATATALAGKEPALGNPASNGYVLSSTTGGTRSWVAQTSHTQNTDTGTSSSTFQIGTGGPKLKNNGGTVEFRNAADDAYVGATASQFNAPAGTAFTASGAEQASPTVTVPTLYFDSTAHLPQYKSASDVLVGTMVAPEAARTANQFCTHVTTAGVCAKAAVAAADLPAALANSTSINGVPVTSGKTFFYTDTPVQASQMPAFTGDCTTSSGAVSVTCAAKLKTVRILGYELPGTGTSGVLQAADFTAAFAAAVNDANAKTLTEASCISDAGSQDITVSVGGSARFTITCVPSASYSRSTTDGSTGFRSTGFTNSAIVAGAVIDITGTANGSTKDVKVFAYGTVN